MIPYPAGRVLKVNGAPAGFVAIALHPYGRLPPPPPGGCAAFPLRPRSAVRPVACPPAAFRRWILQEIWRRAWS
jgi:hypothetical protein